MLLELDHYNPHFFALLLRLLQVNQSDDGNFGLHIFFVSLALEFLVGDNFFTIFVADLKVCCDSRKASESLDPRRCEVCFFVSVPKPSHLRVCPPICFRPAVRSIVSGFCLLWERHVFHAGV
jgi:hypothetical protein